MLNNNDASRAATGGASADVLSDVYTSGGPSPATAGDAQANPFPRIPEYINETVHILAYDEREQAAWGDKWAKRRGDQMLDSEIILDDLLTQNSGEVKHFLSDMALTKYTDAAKNCKYTSVYKYEVYHPSVFTNNLPYWFWHGVPHTTQQQYSAYSNGPHAYRIIDPLNPKQHYFEENDKVHTRRLEIAAKAALMLYRTPSTTELTTNEVEQSNLDMVKRERNNARNEVMQANSGNYYHRNQIYLSKQNEVADLVAPGLSLDRDTFNDIVMLGSSSSELSTLLNKHRNASCYGLWGKWYDRINGFHRGIDIAFGEGHTIYSICDGTVANLVRGSYTTTRNEETGEITKRGTLGYLVVRVPIPNTARYEYLTYMHAKFDDNISIGDIISLGQRIGVEKNHMFWNNNYAGQPPYHTHIELNSSYSNDYSFSQAKSPKESMYSLPPYTFLERCFNMFFNSVINANN